MEPGAEKKQYTPPARPPAQPGGADYFFLCTARQPGACTIFFCAGLAGQGRVLFFLRAGGHEKTVRGACTDFSHGACTDFRAKAPKCIGFCLVSGRAEHYDVSWNSASGPAAGQGRVLFFYAGQPGQGHVLIFFRDPGLPEACTIFLRAPGWPGACTDLFPQARLAGGVY